MRFPFFTAGHLLAPPVRVVRSRPAIAEGERQDYRSWGRRTTFDMQQPLIIHHVSLVIFDLLKLFMTDWPFHFWLLKLKPSVTQTWCTLEESSCLQTGAVCDTSQFEVLSTFSQHSFCPNGTFNSSICGVKLFMRLPHVLWTRSEWFMAGWRMSAESLNAFQSNFYLSVLGLSFQACFHFAVSTMAN